MGTPRVPARRILLTVVAAAAIATGCGTAASTETAAVTATEASAASPAAATTAGGATTSAGSARSKGGGIGIVRVARGLQAPVYVAAAPGEPTRLYVVEQAGRIRVLVNGKLQRRAFLDIRTSVRSGGEQGFLSVAFHPDYATNRLFYVNYTDTSGDTRVVEYRSRAGRTPLKVRELLAVDQPYSNHNGGQLQFGPDGLLYVGMGDGGAGGDPQNLAQNPSSRLGKLLRIDVDRSGADWRIAGTGLRNPWRFSFDRTSGDLWIGDVGQNKWEEIDFLARARLGQTVNYGWDVLEGSHPYEDKDFTGSDPVVAPIYEYGRGDGCSVTGGYVYRGSRVQAAAGRYFFGDFCTGTVWSLVERDGKASDVRRHSFTVAGLSSFGENGRGELFLVSRADGALYRLSAT